jgi:hypothetical protein
MWQHVEAAHSRHIDIGQYQYQCSFAGLGDTPQRLRRRSGEIHVKAAGAQIAAELLPEQEFDIWFVIHHQN